EQDRLGGTGLRVGNELEGGLGRNERTEGVLGVGPEVHSQHLVGWLRLPTIVDLFTVRRVRRWPTLSAEVVDPDETLLEPRRTGDLPVVAHQVEQRLGAGLGRQHTVAEWAVAELLLDVPP